MSKNNNQLKEIKLYFDIDKEIEYLNEMNKKGWKLLYIQAGCRYIFEKSYPDEYVTILHAEEKEDIAKATAFAAQCGYESVPHTLDGIGELLYLTGKKSEISEEFVNDGDLKIKAYNIIVRNFKRLRIPFYCCILPFLFFFFCAYVISLYDPTTAIIYSLLPILGTAFCIICLVKLQLIINRYNKRIQNIRNSKSIYE